MADRSGLAPQMLYQGVQKESFGYKMLAAMGWQEGSGLGANKQGIKEHIKVKKKQDAMGVGAVENANRNRDWTTGMVSYDKILSTLKEVTSRHAGGPGSSSSSEEEESEEDSSGSETSSDDDEKPGRKKGKQPPKKKEKKGSTAAAAVGKKGNRTKKEAAAASGSPSSGSDSDSDDSDSDDGKAKRRAKKKKKKTNKNVQGGDKSGGMAAKSGTDKKRKAASTSSSSSSDSSSSESDASSSDSDGGGGPSHLANPQRVKVSTHVGRYTKRVRGKLVQGYSSSDLAAILGAAPGSSAEPSPAPFAAAPEPAAAPRAPSPAPPTRRPVTAAKADPKAVAPDAEPAADGVVAHVNSTVGKRWWASAFVRAGLMGSMRHEVCHKEEPAAAGKRSVHVHGFSEQDQTALYEATQNGATAGRQGLGRADMPKKVAGVRWAGTKTRIDDSDDEEEDGEERERDGRAEPGSKSEGDAFGRSEDEDASEQGVVVIKPARQQAAQAAAAAAAATAAPAGKKRPAAEAEGKSRGAAEAAPGATQEQPSAKKRKATKAGSKGDGAAGGSAGGGGGPSATAAAAATAAAPKWKKVLRCLLEAAPKRKLKLSKLHKAALKAARLEDAEEEVRKAAIGSMMKKARACGKLFELTDTHVRLLVAAA